MNLQIIEVVKTNQKAKRLYLTTNGAAYTYDGNNLVKETTTKAGVYRVYDYYKSQPKKAIPKSLSSLVIEMDFILDSLVEKDHIRVTMD